uniref:Uncharacterized protein n=1 Tax=Cacopsylla melanoneura TaxID=428564 RepID=A0A8D8VGI4_9HEMI
MLDISFELGSHLDIEIERIVYTEKTWSQWSPITHSHYHTHSDKLHITEKSRGFFTQKSNGHPSHTPSIIHPPHSGGSSKISRGLYCRTKRTKRKAYLKNRYIREIKFKDVES